MVKAIRQAGLKFTVALLRLFVRPARPGWRHTTRPLDLTGR
jgi:hypothetical protein